MKIALLVVALAVAVACTEAADWALLVAGSNGYYNYRHQSDVYDMYQILHENGIPDDHIVAMHYDDIANNPQNPKPGQVFNWPGGPDVYKGVPKDYTGGLVTPTNFLKILQGEDMTGIGSGKTIKSTSGDNIFVFYTDHGATGLVAFPSGGYLYATALTPVLKSMAEAHKFNKMVFYLEACESGSMFNAQLPDNIKIYGMTASDPTESSWACDYDQTVQAYLNDCFSRNFMLDMRKHASGETLGQQYQAVLAETTQSHVCQYGDLTFQDEAVSDFIGRSASRHLLLGKRLLRSSNAVDSRMSVLATMEKLAETATGARRAELREMHTAETIKMMRADKLFSELRARLPSQEFASNDDICHTASEIDHACVQASVEVMEAECGRFDDYMLAKTKHLASFCKAGVKPAALRAALKNLC